MWFIYSSMYYVFYFKNRPQCFCYYIYILLRAFIWRIKRFLVCGYNNRKTSEIKFAPSVSDARSMIKVCSKPAQQGAYTCLVPGSTANPRRAPTGTRSRSVDGFYYLNARKRLLFVGRFYLNFVKNNYLLKLILFSYQPICVLL